MDYQPGNPQNGPGGGYNPYNNNPSNNPYNPYGAPLQPAPMKSRGDGMATASLILGIISLVSLLLLRISTPFLLGGVGIVLAILSRGGTKKIIGKAKAGIICAVTAIVLDIAFCVFAVWLTFVLPNHSPAFREQINKICEEQYGVSYDEIIEELDDLWNGDLDDFE